jgi:hypothetical protein
MQLRSHVRVLVICAVASSAAVVQAADSAQNASGASTHASQAVTMGITASGQAVLGVAAVPLLSVGAVGMSIGAGSAAAGRGSAAAATGVSSHDPLPVTDQTITVNSPTEALKSRAGTPPR